MAWKHITRIVFICTALIVMFGTSPVCADNGSFYVQNNLVSDIKGAARTDINLVNAWGIDASPTGPWWVNSNGKGLSIVYDGNGAPAPATGPIVVTVPPPGASGTSAPTGIVFNVFNGSNDFLVAPGEPAIF